MTRKIAIFRALYLGDLLLAVPALRSIRARFPAAEITLIGLPWAASFVQRFARYIDRFVEFRGYPGIEEVGLDPERIACFLDEQQAYGYDLVIQMHGSGRISNKFALALGGKVTAGYYEQRPPVGLNVGMPYPEDRPEVLRNLGLAELLGCQNLDPQLEFPLYRADRLEANRLLCSAPNRPANDAITSPPERVASSFAQAGRAENVQKAARPCIGLHTGAKPPVRRWPAAYFAQVADYFAQRFNAQIILTGGSNEEATVQAVAERMHAPSLNVAGQTSLGGLAALISKVNLYISNDTGPAHIANAVDTPSVTIFGPVDPSRWASLDQTRHPIVRRPVACSPCEHWECPIDHRCLRWVTPEMVIRVAEELLVKGAVACSA